MLRTCNSAGRGRSASDIAMMTRSRTDSYSIVISSARGRDATAWRIALPEWPLGSKPKSSSSCSSRRRSIGTSSGGTLSASLVHRPAWTPIPTTLSPCLTGTTTRSSGTRRCTVDLRSALAISGTPPARIGAVELQIHHRFAAALVLAKGLDGAQVTLGVAAGADDRVKQAVDGELTGGDGIGDGIDEERHVLVDDANAHPPVAGFAA